MRPTVVLALIGAVDLVLAAVLAVALSRRRNLLAALRPPAVRLRRYALAPFAFGLLAWIVAGVYLWLNPGSRADEANLGWLAYTIWLVVPICLLAGA
ncbi:MAG: hypothetical protein ACXVY6_08260 [Gaiellaceae bacterium]